jgi:serine/threonine protein kinase
MISFSCSQCGMKLKVKTEFAGRSFRCPTCRKPMTVPPPDRAQADVGAGRIDGSISTLAKAGVDACVTLDQSISAPRPGSKSVGELLDRRARSDARYTIEEEIARGGMGVVLRALDCDIRREVAVKYLLSQTDPGKKARFVEEAQITGQLEHPNIVPIHELGIDAQKRLFISMKMVKGRSLAQVLDELRQKPKIAEKEYPQGRLLNILVSICNALAYAHSRGVIHRDLKPANIMIGDFGEVYVMDWGLAKVKASGGREPPEKRHAHESATHSGGSRPPLAAAPSGSLSLPDLTREGAVLGTPVYMPPEQAAGQIQVIDQRSDVYSLGAILYEMLTLQPPIDRAGGELAILIRVAQGEIVPPEERVRRAGGAGARSVPRELSAVSMKAMAREKQDRYPNVEALRRDIEWFQQGRSVSAKEDTRREIAWKFVKRNKALCAATLVVAVVLVWSSVVNFLARHEAETASAQTRERTEQAVPALVKAARLGVVQRDYQNALDQVNLALAYSPDDPEALLLKGQLLIVQQDYAGARTYLEKYLSQKSGDAKVKTLLDLCRKPHPGDEATSLSFARVFNQQEAYGLIDGVLAPYGKNSVEARNLLFQKYRKKIEENWPGLGDRLNVSPDGLRLDFNNLKELRDLAPLRGMPLTYLNLAFSPQVQDLTPLKGMPLTSLDLFGSDLVSDLTPLRGMQLTFFSTTSNRVTDLTPLQGMPLKTLVFGHCAGIRDLTPLQDSELTDLRCGPGPVAANLGHLRRVKSLKTIEVTERGRFAAAEFWKRYDAGEFK